MFRKLAEKESRRKLLRLRLEHARCCANYVGAMDLSHDRHYHPYVGQISGQLLKSLEVYAEFCRLQMNRAWVRVQRYERKLARR